MISKNRRRLGLEKLDDRRVLNAGPIGPEFALLSTNATTGAIQISSQGQTQDVLVSSHPDAQNGPLETLFAADFNNDGTTDLLSSDATDGRWWLQINDGTQLFPFPVGPGLSGNQLLAAEDFNQDGLPDIASFNPTTKQLIVSVNQGTSFSHQVWGSFPTRLLVEEIFVEDFSGDGELDILAAQYDGEFVLAVNQGTSFSVQSWGAFPDFGWTNVLSGEFNGDAFADIVALAPDSTWWIWQGTPTGFGNAQSFGHWKMASGWTDIRVADFSNDGIDDLVSRTPDGNLYVATSEMNRFNTWIWGSGWLDSAGWTNVSAVDVNNDNLPDQVGKAQDGTWWYAINNGGTFSNYFWQRAADANLLVTDFQAPAMDVIDSLPNDGVDARTLVINAFLNNQNLIEIEANGPLQIDGITLTSASGSLLPPTSGGALPSSTSFETQYGPFAFRLNGQTLLLDTGWNSSGQPDLVITVNVGGVDYPVRLPRAVGPAVTEPTLSAAEANALYFSTLPNDVIVPTFVGATPVDEDSIVNTVSYDNAALRVYLNDSNRIVVEPTQTLSLTGIEFLSASGSLIPIGNGTLDVPADPFLEVIANSTTRIILTSNNWPLELVEELTLDIGWVPNATVQDLIVQYRLSDQTGNQQAHVAEPLRLPISDAPSTETTNGAVRNSPAIEPDTATTIGTVRVLPLVDPENPETTVSAVRILDQPEDPEALPNFGAGRFI